MLVPWLLCLLALSPTVLVVHLCHRTSDCYIYNTLADPVQKCQEGQWWSNRNNKCERCAPGQLKSEYGYSLCRLCHHRTVSDSMGAANCSTCPENNSTGDHNQTSCPAGSPRPCVYSKNDVEVSRYSPELLYPPPPSLETKFYQSCWPVFLYTICGLVLLGATAVLCHRLFHNLIHSMGNGQDEPLFRGTRGTNIAALP
mgnify:CR=1 FL=1